MTANTDMEWPDCNYSSVLNGFLQRITVKVVICNNEESDKRVTILYRYTQGFGNIIINNDIPENDDVDEVKINVDSYIFRKLVISQNFTMDIFIIFTFILIICIMLQAVRDG